MNFSLPPRPQYTHGPQNRYGHRNPTWGLGSGHHAADKARYNTDLLRSEPLLTLAFRRYVHANYRFIVDPRGDYRAQAVDANVHLDWNFVLQILASAQTQCSACPICLSTPVAPRMAKCGHIFCLPCLIRYMHSADDTNPFPDKKARWRKCPICWDSIYASETRPVRWFVGQEANPPREGEDVVLRLVMRRLGSTLALPRDGADAHSDTDDIPWYFVAEVMDYARIMKGTEEYMVEQYETEIEQMRQQETEDELLYGDEPEWTQRAISAIREAQGRIKGLGNPPSTPTPTLEKKKKRAPIVFNQGDESVPDMYTIRHAAISGQSSAEVSIVSDVLVSNTFGQLVDPPSRSPEKFAASSSSSSNADTTVLFGHGHSSPRPRPQLREAANNKSPLGRDSAYYFYQALLHYYLAPLDIRILKAAFGSFASFPTTILPRLDHVSTGHVIDDDLRKRAKYLAHLPSGCEVSFLECDWTDVVPPEILEQFKPEVERRRKKNRDKEIREEKDRVRAEKREEDQRWATARRKRSSILRESISEDGFDPLDSSERVGFSSSFETSQLSSIPPWSNSTHPRNVSAFATLASPSTSPVAPRTVWGTAVIPPSSPPSHAKHHEPEVSDNDGWLQGWEQDLLQEVDMVAQIPAGSFGESAIPQGIQENSSKKKKGKKITLMSTNVRRGA